MRPLKVIRPVPAKWSPATTDFWTSASCHVFISLAVIFLALYFLPDTVSWLFFVVGGLLTYAIVKEYWVDPRVEQGQDTKTGTVDFAFYVLGLIVALLLITMAHVWLGRPW
jgi:hypothetical protein